MPAPLTLAARSEEQLENEMLLPSFELQADKSKKLVRLWNNKFNLN